MLTLSTVRNIAENGKVIGLAVLPHDRPKQLKSLLEQDLTVHIGRRVHGQRQLFCALLMQPLRPQEILHVMQAASPAPEFGDTIDEVQADLEMPASATAGDPDDRELYTKHLRKFGRDWKYVASVATTLNRALEEPIAEGPDPPVIPTVDPEPIWAKKPLDEQIRCLRALGEHALIRKFFARRSGKSYRGMPLHELYDITMWCGRADMLIDLCLGYLGVEKRMSTDEIIMHAIAAAESHRYCIVRNADAGRCVLVHNNARTQQFLGNLWTTIQNGTDYRVQFGVTVELDDQGRKSLSAVPELQECHPTAGIAMIWEETVGGQAQWIDGSTRCRMKTPGAWWGRHVSVPILSDLGRMLAAALSHGTTVRRWPRAMELEEDGYKQPLGPAQALLLVRMHTYARDILRSRFFRALRKKANDAPEV